ELEPVWIESYGNVALTGEPLLFEQYVQDLKRYFEVIAFSPKKNQFATVFSDITERRTFMRELQQERDKAQKYLEIVEVILLVLNEKGEITLINKKGNQILGYKEDELLGKNWFETCVPEKSREKVKGVFKKLSAGKEELSNGYENPVLTKSGEERIIAWHNALLWEWVDDKKHITGILSSGEDITERVRAENLLSALNRAAVAIGSVQTQEDIFNAIAAELKQLDISCMLFPLDETRGKLFPEYLSYDSALLKAAEKLMDIKRGNFSFSVDAVDVFQQVIREKKTLFTDKPEQTLRRIFPKHTKLFTARAMKNLHIQKNIISPLIIEGQAIGAFLVQSNTLTQEDTPAITAFADQLSSAWRNVKLLQDLRKNVDDAVHTIAATVEARDPYTAGHQARVADLAAEIAREMKLTDEQVKGVRMAGIIHDLGKVQIPAEILSKPGKISELEYEIIKTHPRVGFDLLKEIEFPWPIAQMVLQHHEKMDGSGYPQGLKGNEIMLEARILCVADIVEAMSSHRPYRPALGVKKALEQIRKDRGTLLDSDVVDACLKVFEGGYTFLEKDTA
ncbi:MAG: HD domain-containing protein, partial [Anaerolineaceae bacterium]|nr:HD domain-containing protein [Anaerolineaceae bacterium]